MAEPMKTTTRVNKVSPSMAERLQNAARVASASMQNVAPLNQNALNRAIKKAEEFTDWNNHNEARITLTKFFKYDDLTQSYKQIQKEHHEAGSLTRDLYERRMNNDRIFDERVREQYGEDVLRKIRRGL